MSPDLKQSPPVKGCPLFAIAALGMLGSLATAVALGAHAVWLAVS